MFVTHLNYGKIFCFFGIKRFAWLFKRLLLKSLLKRASVLEALKAGRSVAYIDGAYHIIIVSDGDFITIDCIIL